MGTEDGRGKFKAPLRSVLGFGLGSIKPIQVLLRILFSKKQNSNLILL